MDTKSCNIESVVKRRAGHVLVTYNNDLYMWGGYMEEEHEETYNLMTESNAHFHNPDEVWVYSPFLNIWSRKICAGDIPLQLSGSCAGVINHYMYLFGGFNGDEIIEGSSNILWRLDLLSFVWTLINPSGFPPFACEMSASCVYRDRFYIFGGYGPIITNMSENAPVKVAFDIESEITMKGWLDQLVYYDASNNCWTWPKAKGLKPCPRAAHAAALLKKKAFIFGGRNKVRRLNDFHCIDLETHRWSVVYLSANSTVPIGRSWHSLNDISSDKLLLYGGFSSMCQVLNDCWLAQINCTSTDEVEGVWEELDLPYDHGEPRCNHCAASISSGQIVIVSGLTQPYYLMMYLLVISLGVYK